MLAACPDVHKWAIMDRDALSRWADGNVTLLGDACHPMTPYMAQGAAMAIEDAAILSHCLADVDPGFYCAAYLRAWALETHLRAYLRESFGPAWFEHREAGDALRRFWAEGQRLGAEEMLDELTGRRLEFGVLLEDLGLVGA